MFITWRTLALTSLFLQSVGFGLFGSHRLSHVHPSFTAEVTTDRRLDENSSLTRGCGGEGVMWKKTLNACPITGIASD